MTAQRPYAVFDIDGTLIRWQLYHAIADELVEKGYINTTLFEPVKRARLQWKNREHEAAFKDYEIVLIEIFDQAMKHIKVSQFQAAAQQAFDKYKTQTYAYTRSLISDLRDKGYLLFAISASQSEIVELLATYYGFDDYGGSQYEVNNGQFTGQVDVLKSDKKPILLRALVAKHDASQVGSIAIGDSEGDIPMLSVVEQPIAFNPTKELFNHASTQGWKLVIERKNMWYEMEPRNGSYILAKTNA